MKRQLPLLIILVMGIFTIVTNFIPAKPIADANQMFGDIVKVTPSSKVVGDMALMMVSQDLSVADVENPDKDV
ncbi:MAG: hypothetical protein MUP52_11395, partial [Candidatus Aminicenantes bacterium]|nr:hypothetical protein [Candidatus Aminicenantes bacterium]